MLVIDTKISLFRLTPELAQKQGRYYHLPKTDQAIAELPGGDRSNQ